MKAFQLLLIFVTAQYLTACNTKTPALFKKITASQSGIDFENTIAESDSINPMNVVNIYNGGGVGIGDFNGDGLPDIYFTGNMVASNSTLTEAVFHLKMLQKKRGPKEWGDGPGVSPL